MEYHQITIDEYLSMKAEIAENLKTTADNMFRIGYMLRVIAGNESFRQDGYGSITEFARKEYGLSPTSTSRFIDINEKFCDPDNPQLMQERYKGMGAAKLQEMLYLTDEQLEEVTADMTVKEIRQLRHETKEASALDIARLKLDSEKRKLATYQKEINDWKQLAESGSCPSNNNSCIRTQWGHGDKEQKEGAEECRKCWKKHVKANISAISECGRIIYKLEYEISSLEKTSEHLEDEVKEDTFATSQMPEMPENASTESNFEENEESDAETSGIMDEEEQVCEEPTAMADVTDMAAVINSYVDMLASYVQSRGISIEEAAGQNALVTCNGSDYYITLEDNMIVFKTELVEKSFTAEAGGIFGQVRKKIEDSKPTIVEVKENTVRKCITGKNPYGLCSCCGTDGIKCCAECKEDCNGRCGWLDDEKVQKTPPSVTDTLIQDVKPAVNDYARVAKEELEKAKSYMEQIMKSGEIKDKPKHITKYKMLVAALSGFLGDIENESMYKTLMPGAGQQPELKKLKNNDQRAEFLKNYREWGLWYEDPNINYRYYKYDFEDGTRIVVAECLSWEKKKDRPWVEDKDKPPVYGNPSYHMYNPAGKQIAKGVTMREFYQHYGDSATLMIDFLKVLQKEK